MANSNSPIDPNSPVEEFAIVEDVNDQTLSSDKTWTPSIREEDSDEDYDLDNGGSMWQEALIQFKTSVPTSTRSTLT